MSAPCSECGQPPRDYLRRGMCLACYRRWRRATDPGFADRVRRSSAAWKDRNREANRASDRRRSRDEALRGRCTSCGGLMGAGVPGDGVCVSCVAERHRQRVGVIERMWAEGATQAEIARVLGSTAGAVGADIRRLRIAGHSLPYRYRRKVAA